MLRAVERLLDPATRQVVRSWIEQDINGWRNEVIPISAVCRQVDKFTDPLPDEVFDALYLLARQKHLKEKLDAERTYATGAQLLLKLIEDRKAKRARSC
jgi:hypothetical protein